MQHVKGIVAPLQVSSGGWSAFWPDSSRIVSLLKLSCPAFAFLHSVTSLMSRFSVLLQRFRAGSAGGFLLVCQCVIYGPAVLGQQSLPHAFLQRYCLDCHQGETPSAGLDLSVAYALETAAGFQTLEHVYDRIRLRQMPPADAEQPSAAAREAALVQLGDQLTQAHRRIRGTILRRLNRQEYQNTLNDLFGIQRDLQSMFPEDGRAHGFDNVGEALGVSMVHLERSLQAAELVLSDSIASTLAAPAADLITAGYKETREAEQFLGKKWKLLEDDAVVRFNGRGYPTGMIRGTNVRERGRYRVTVSGYAYQSDVPITFSVEGTSFARGSDKPVYGYWAFDPGSPQDPDSLQTIEFEAWIERNYMVAIEPYGIADPGRYQRETIEDYAGPGLAIRQVTLEGPLTDEWPSAGHRLIFGDLPRPEIAPRNPADRNRSSYRPQFELQLADEAADIDQCLQRVATAAFRRPVDSAELLEYRALYDEQRTSGSTPEQALRIAVTAILCSPRFLYLQEDAGQLDDWALASRLSYFLTRTLPDRALLQAAASGVLHSPAELRRQTERLLQDPRGERFITDLCDNWLDLRELDFTEPDRTLFPEYDEYLRYSMPRETRSFVRHLIAENLPVSNLVRSRFAMLNDRLAAHYGLPDVYGSEIRAVTLPAGSVRGGLLSQASILKVTANGTNTSPVVRGAWVLERLMGITPPPPPPGIPGVEPDIRGATTLREQLVKHRNLESCQGCHRLIDPPGFALESFNPIGGWRTFYRSTGAGERLDVEVDGRRVNYRVGLDVDSSGITSDGVAFAGFTEYRDLLADDERLLTHTLAVKLATFACGREPGFSDRPELERIVNAAESSGFGIRDLIHLVVQSELFRNK